MSFPFERKWYGRAGREFSLFLPENFSTRSEIMLSCCGGRKSDAQIKENLGSAPLGFQSSMRYNFNLHLPRINSKLPIFVWQTLAIARGANICTKIVSEKIGFF